MGPTASSFSSHRFPIVAGWLIVPSLAPLSGGNLRSWRPISLASLFGWLSFNRRPLGRSPPQLLVYNLVTSRCISSHLISSSLLPQLLCHRLLALTTRSFLPPATFTALQIAHIQIAQPTKFLSVQLRPLSPPSRRVLIVRPPSQFRLSPESLHSTHRSGSSISRTRTTTALPTRFPLWFSPTHQSTLSSRSIGACATAKSTVTYQSLQSTSVSPRYGATAHPSPKNKSVLWSSRARCIDVSGSGLTIPV